MKKEDGQIIMVPPPGASTSSSSPSLSPSPLDLALISFRSLDLEWTLARNDPVLSLLLVTDDEKEEAEGSEPTELDTDEARRTCRCLPVSTPFPRASDCDCDLDSHTGLFRGTGATGLNLCLWFRQQGVATRVIFRWPARGASLRLQQTNNVVLQRP